MVADGGFNPHRGILLFLTKGRPARTARMRGFNPHRGILLFLTSTCAPTSAPPATVFQSQSGHSALSNHSCVVYPSSVRYLCFNPHRGILLFLTSPFFTGSFPFSLFQSPSGHSALSNTRPRRPHTASASQVSIPIGAFCSF